MSADATVAPTLDRGLLCPGHGQSHSGAMRSIEPSGAQLRTENLEIPGLVLRTIPE